MYVICEYIELAVAGSRQWLVGQGTKDLREYKGRVFQNVTQEIGIKWGEKTTDRVFVGKITRKVPLRRPRRRRNRMG